MSVRAGGLSALLLSHISWLLLVPNAKLVRAFAESGAALKGSTPNPRVPHAPTIFDQFLSKHEFPRTYPCRRNVASATILQASLAAPRDWHETSMNVSCDLMASSHDAMLAPTMGSRRTACVITSCFCPKLEFDSLETCVNVASRCHRTKLKKVQKRSRMDPKLLLLLKSDLYTLSCLVDFEQLDLEVQGGVGRDNRRVSTGAVSVVGSAAASN